MLMNTLRVGRRAWPASLLFASVVLLAEACSSAAGDKPQRPTAMVASTAPTGAGRYAVNNLAICAIVAQDRIKCLPEGVHSAVVLRGIKGARAVAITSENDLRIYGLRSNGDVASWRSVRSTPRAVPGIHHAVALSAGEAPSACVVLHDGTAKCWGNNGHGELGDGTHQSHQSPTPVIGLRDAVAISTGNARTCAVTRSGSVWCWGYGDAEDNDPGFGLGDGSDHGSAVPVPVRMPGPASAVTAGFSSSCALLQSGAIACWGLNGDGIVGNGTTDVALLPSIVVGITSAVSIAQGNKHVCAVLGVGTVECWGSEAQAVDGGVAPGPQGAHGPGNDSPGVRTGVSDAVSVAAHTGTTCVLRRSHRLYCWGYVLGHDRRTPIAVPGLVVGP